MVSTSPDDQKPADSDSERRLLDSLNAYIREQLPPGAATAAPGHFTVWDRAWVMALLAALVLLANVVPDGLLPERFFGDERYKTYTEQLFTWILTGIGDGMAGIIFGATMLLLLPLTLMSVFTPFAVRLLLVSVKFGGRIVSYVYGVSTIGNVLGTLVTTFTLMPLYGSRALTMVFAAVTIACGLLMVVGDRYLRGQDTGRDTGQDAGKAA